MTYNKLFNKVKNFTLGSIIMAIPFAASIAPTYGVSETGTFGVSATVVTTCTVSATNMAFGNYQFTAASQATSTLTINCTPGYAYKVGLNSGSYSSDVAARLMSTGGPTDRLPYYLYRDAGRSLNWGNTPNVDAINSAGTGTPQTFTVFGQINAGEVAVAGNYSDTVTVTILPY